MKNCTRTDTIKGEVHCEHFFKNATPQYWHSQAKKSDQKIRPIYASARCRLASPAGRLCDTTGHADGYLRRERSDFPLSSAVTPRSRSCELGVERGPGLLRLGQDPLDELLHRGYVSDPADRLPREEEPLLRITVVDAMEEAGDSRRPYTYPV